MEGVTIGQAEAQKRVNQAAAVIVTHAGVQGMVMVVVILLLMIVLLGWSVSYNKGSNRKDDRHRL